MASLSDEKKSSLWWSALRQDQDPLLARRAEQDSLTLGLSILEPLTQKEYLDRFAHFTARKGKGSNFLFFYRKIEEWAHSVYRLEVPEVRFDISLMEQIQQLEAALPKENFWEERSSLWWAAVRKGRDDVVMDPDGWDRGNFSISLLEKITQTSYIQRVKRSSTLGTLGSNFGGFYRDIKEMAREKYGVVVPEAHKKLSPVEQVRWLEEAIQESLLEEKRRSLPREDPSQEKRSSLWWSAVRKGRDDVVMDADGWDRWHMASSLLEPITQEEYTGRVDRCTTMGRMGSNFEDFYGEVKDWVQKKYGVVVPESNTNMSPTTEQVQWLETELQKVK